MPHCAAYGRATPPPPCHSKSHPAKQTRPPASCGAAIQIPGTGSNLQHATTASTTAAFAHFRQKTHASRQTAPLNFKTNETFNAF